MTAVCWFIVEKVSRGSYTSLMQPLLHVTSINAVVQVLSAVWLQHSATSAADQAPSPSFFLSTPCGGGLGSTAWGVNLGF